jgi:hypothetical protein
MRNLRDAIFAASDTPIETVEVPEWGVTVGIRSMSAKSRAAVMELAQQGDGIDADKVLGMWARTLQGCIVDPETGDAVFTLDDMEALMDKSATVIERLWTMCFEQSGMTEDKVNEAGKDS